MLLLMPTLLWGATPKFDVDDILSRYSDYNNVILDNFVDIVIDIVDDSLKVSSHTTQSVLLLNENSKQGSINSIYYSDFEVVDNIKAYSFIPNGKRYKKLKAVEHRTTSNESGSVFYDDSKIIEVLYPQVERGAIMTLDYDRHLKDAHFLSSFAFQGYIPILDSRLRVKVHKDVQLQYKLFNDEEGGVTFSKTASNDYWIYEWSSKIDKASKQGCKYTGWQHLLPHVRLYLGEVRFSDRTEYYFRDVDDLHRYYSGFIKHLDVALDSQIIAETLLITSGLDADVDKVKAILYWVQENIKYVAFEHGYRGFIPHDVNYVFQKRYGDCKDMASIIVGMMRSVGIVAHPAWVGTRNIPYRYEELPTNAVDNHMVAVYFNDGEPVILDGTMDMYTYQWTPHHLQGKQLLISMDKDNSIVAEIPITPMEESVVLDSMFFRITAEEVLVGKARKTFGGYYRYEIATLLDGKTKEATKKSLSNTLQKGNNKFQLDTFCFSDYDNREEDVLIDYEFSLDEYVRILGSDMYVNMNLDKNMKDFKIDTTVSAYPIENDFKGVEKCISTMLIPEGYKVTYLPKDFKYSHPKFSIEMTYSSSDSTVTQYKVINLNFLRVEEEDFTPWDDMISQLRRHYNQVVSLTKE